jgi:mannose-P-dolichol utilization defect protein 1
MDYFQFNSFRFNFSVEKSIFPDSFIDFLWAICLPLSIAYKIPQIYSTYKNKCKGELSTLSCGLTLLGSCGRVFTTLREIKNWSVLIMYILNLVLNSIIYTSIFTIQRKSMTRHSY